MTLAPNELIAVVLAIIAFIVYVWFIFEFFVGR